VTKPLDEDPSPPNGGRGKGEGGIASADHGCHPLTPALSPLEARETEAGGSGASPPALELRGVRRVFKTGGARLVVLNGIDLALAPGEIVALVGPSGAGKSTLLHIAGLLERPDEGNVLIGGADCSGLSDERRTLLRRSELGFVYQFHHLLPEFSALENVMLPQMIAGVGRGGAREKAAALLAGVGLAARAGHRPARLSGGEQQRVAIVRALANDPRILLGDEPTGNLDHATGESVIETLVELVRRTRLAALIATHNIALARRLDRIVELEDGKLKWVA
jgi:lipoprotein-releasing system ATP-binding protein